MDSIVQPRSRCSTSQRRHEASRAFGPGGALVRGRGAGVIGLEGDDMAAVLRVARQLRQVLQPQGMSGLRHSWRLRGAGGPCGGDSFRRPHCERRSRAVHAFWRPGRAPPNGSMKGGASGMAAAIYDGSPI
jgi:hypothetical protein